MRLSRCRCLASALVAVALAHAGAALAEDAPAAYAPCNRTATEADVNGAQGAFQAGNASFNEGDYTRAIDYWEDAYRRDCTAHRMLLNLARAYESNDEKRHAVNALKTFLVRSPGTADEAQIHRRIENLEQQIRDEPAAPPTAAPTQTPPDQHPETEPPPAGTTPPATTPPQPATPPPATAAADTTSSGHRSIVPLVVAGAGGAIAIVSGILYLTAQSKIHSAEDDCNHGRIGCSQSVADRGNSGRTQATVSGAFAIGGLAILGGGLVWYFVAKPDPSSGSGTPLTARVAPAFGAGYGGLDVAGAF